MKDWLKGLIFLIVGNFFYDVVPVWTTQYLLSLPNPFYSFGEFLQEFPSIQELTASNTNLDMVIGYVGIAFIAYAIYLFVKEMYRK